MLLIFVASMIAMGMITVIFSVSELLSYRKHEAEHRQSLAKIVCRDSRDAVLHNDRAHAVDTLRSLAADPHILSAWTVLDSGEVFASYVRQPGEGVLRTVQTGDRLMIAPDALADDGGVLSGIFASIKIVYSCADGGKRLCTTVIISDTHELVSRVTNYLSLVLLVLWGVYLLGYLATYRLQRIITDPLDSLVRTMERIRSTKDYSLRVESGRADEIGTLADCFNQMLHEVEVHGEQLLRYQDRLAEMISLRTAELVRVKEQAESDIAGKLTMLKGEGQPPPLSATLALAKGWDERLALYALMTCIDEEVWFFDAAGGFALANRGAGEALGMNLADIALHEADAGGFEIYRIELKSLQRPDLPPFLDLQGVNVRKMEVMLLREGHEQRYQLINSMPVRSGAGAIIGTVFVVRDITLLKEAEEIRLFSSRRLIASEESLRKNLAAELHDEIGRDITALHLFNSVITNSLSPECSEKVGDTTALVQGLLDELSCKVANIISELRPPMLDDFGLGTALGCLAESVSKRHGIPVDVCADDSFPRLEGEVESALYRIAQEALNNAVKHSGAQLITITLEGAGDQVHLVITDNGSGFDAGGSFGTARRPSWGVTIMRERAESIGGKFSLESAPGAGTTITVELGREI